MFDRFTDHNKKIMSMARKAALRLKHEYIGTEHMLLALLELDQTTASEILATLDVDRATLRAEFEETLKPGRDRVVLDSLPFTPKSKRALELTMQEASQTSCKHIGSEHLLLGLIQSEDTAAGQALAFAGVTSYRTRLAILPPGERPSADSMRLLLISNSTMHGGDYLAHCADEIRDYLGLKRRVAFVPYAIADHDAYEAKAIEAFAAMDLQLTSVHRSPEPCNAVHDANAVFVGGGNTFRLLASLYRTGLLNAIQRGVSAGMPYIGSSAGTNIATLSIRTTNDMPIVMPPSFDALALVPFHINPHYLDPDPGSTHMGETREERLMQFHEDNATPVLAIREGCILRVEDQKMELRGTTGARLFRRGQPPEEFTPNCDLSFLLKTPDQR